MIYSLPSRFKGALLGCLISEGLALNQKQIDFSFEQCSLPFKIAIGGIKSIINSGELNSQSWLTNLISNQIDYLTLKNKANSNQTAIISLPVSLFYYENLKNLTNNLQSTLNLWHNRDLPSENLLVWGYLIKLILDHQLNLDQIISQLTLTMEKQQVLIPEIFFKIDNYIQQRTPLEQVSNYLHHNCHQDLGAIAQSIYCFATLPHNFSLGLERTLRSNYQPKLTTNLTATLLGLYNSHNHIPLAWRLSLQKSKLGQEIEALSENLFAVWSGSYQGKTIESDQPCYSLGIIQTRNKRIKVKSRLN